MIGRRTALKWVANAAVTCSVIGRSSFAHGIATYSLATRGYGTDPDLSKHYAPSDLWPLTFTQSQRASATSLSDLIIPADQRSPAASAVGVIDFIDEWISAPYPEHKADRAIVLNGITWIDKESRGRFDVPFAQLIAIQQRSICDDICYLPNAKRQFIDAATFFARYRDLTAGGFYTTPAGRSDLQYIGNVPLASFDGPPLDVLKRVGLVS
jgi:hypothetical protein